MVYKDRLETN